MKKITLSFKISFIWDPGAQPDRALRMTEGPHCSRHEYRGLDCALPDPCSLDSS